MFHGKEGIIYKAETVYNRDLRKEIFFSVPALPQAVSALGRRLALCCCLAFFLWVMENVLKDMYLTLLQLSARNILSARFKNKKNTMPQTGVTCWSCHSEMGVQGHVSGTDADLKTSHLFFFAPKSFSLSLKYLIPLYHERIFLHGPLAG